MHKSFNSLWLSWALVTSVGSTIGFPLGNIIAEYCFPNTYLIEQKIFYLLTLICISGLAVSVGQWAILRTRLEKSWMWIPATAISIPLGFLIGFWVKDSLILHSLYMVSPLIVPSVDWIFPFIMPSVAGMFIGLLQCFALHKKLKASFGWILISGLSWGIALNQTIGNFIATSSLPTSKILI